MIESDARPRRKKVDARTKETRAALIEKAEMLFASHGIDAVSLREIGIAIGSSNTNVVGYHFGTREDLILAIFRHRLGYIDVRRADLLGEALRTGRNRNLVALLDAMWRPLLEQRDQNGRHSYATFLDQLLRSDHLHLRSLVAADFMIANTLAFRIADTCGRELDAAFQTQLYIGFAMVTATLHIIDARACTPDAAEALFAQSISMLASALTVPSF